MDLIDVLILALRLVLVVLLYLFLATVLRMAAGGLRRSASAIVRSADRRVDAALKLVVLEPGNSSLTPGQVLELIDGATLGRTEPADVAFADPAVSSEHARIDRVGRAWVITDLGSTNGTRLNDQRVDGRAPLATGDILSLGTVRLRVQTR